MSAIRASRKCTPLEYAEEECKPSWRLPDFWVMRERWAWPSPKEALSLLGCGLWLAAHPAAGDVMEGTGGARKVRFAGKSRGKSGGYRIITFYSGPDIPVFLLNIFAKNERANLTPKERVTLKAILGEMVRTYRSRKELK